MTRPLSAVLSASRLAVACLLFAAANADAAITVTGDVDPNPPMQGDFVTVGFGGIGTLDIEGGDSLSIGNLIVGSQGAGFASVSGAGSSLSVDNTISVGGVLGRFDVLDGASVRVGGTFGLASSGGIADMRVAGDRTLVEVGEELSVGLEGSSTLEITDRATVLTRSLGVGTGGEIRVSGEGTRIAKRFFSSTSDFVNGRLEVSNGGSVDLEEAVFGTDSRLVLDQGTVRVSNPTNNGVISGAGFLDVGFGQFLNGGRIETQSGQTLLIDLGDFGFFSSLVNDGEVLSDGGTVELDGRLMNNASGRVTLRDGQLRVNAGQEMFAIENDNLIAAVGGLNDIHGRVVNEDQGTIAVTNNSTLVFHDVVTSVNGGDISVMPGSRAVFLDGLDINPLGTFQANLAGTDDDTGFGVAEVVGVANISGQVSVALAEGFAPSLGDRFDLLTASGGVTGEPTLGEAADPGAGLRWELETSETFLALVAVPELDGDFNLDGSVDAADYTTWRDGFGTAFDASDYDVWVGNFGATSPATALAVPEPNAAGLLGLALVGVATGRRK